MMKARGFSVMNILRKVIPSLIFFGLVYEVAALLENEISSDLLGQIAILNDHIVPAYILSLCFVGGLILALIGIEHELDEQPMNYRWNIAKIVVEVISSLGAAASAIIGNSVLTNIKPLIQLIQTYQPQSLVVLGVLLVVLSAGVPILRGIARYYSGVEDPVHLLKQLKDDYEDHLEYYRLATAAQFSLDVVPAPGKVTPIERRSVPPVPPAPPKSSTEEKVYHYYIRADQRLLILADPGCGKSTQLYLLGSALAKSALDPDSLPSLRKLSVWKRLLKVLFFWRGEILDSNFPPIPVILDLSTWPINHADIETWLVSEIHRLFEIRRATARNWIRLGKIVPLLDALDAVEPDFRVPCLNELNPYISNNSRPLVVCCRTHEYNDSRDGKFALIRLNLQQAVEIPRLKEGEVIDVLVNIANANPGTAQEVAVIDLKKTLEQELAAFQTRGSRGSKDVMHTLQTPFLLSLAIINLLNRGEDLLRNGSEDLIEQLRDVAQTSVALEEKEEKEEKDYRIQRILFDGYVSTLLRRRPDGERASGDEVQQTEKTLSWLANEMKQKEKDQLTFYTSDLQSNSLPTPKAKQRYGATVGWIRLILRIAVGVALGGALAFMITKAYALGGGAKVFGGALDTIPGVIGRAVFGIIGGLGVGLGIAEVLDAARKPGSGENDANADETARASLWQRLLNWVMHSQRGIRQTLVVAILTAILAAVIAGFAGRFGATLPEKLITALVIGIGVGLCVGIVIGPAGIYSNGRRSAHRNIHLSYLLLQAIRTILFYALLGIFGAGLLVGLLFFLVALQSLPPDKALTAGLEEVIDAAIVGGVICGIIGLNIALGNGGADFVQYLIIRQELRLAKIVSMSLPKFLEKAVRDRLLARDGGGYTFIVKSKMLRDYFARKFEVENRALIAQQESEEAPKRSVLRRAIESKIVQSVWRTINFPPRERKGALSSPSPDSPEASPEA
jgi:hypothetical protein